MSTNPVLVIAVVALLVSLGAASAWLVWRRRQQRDIGRRLRETARGVLADFVMPDGNGGQIQVQYALLTGRGIVILDIKDVTGNVFGSEGMQEWTVIDHNRRYTFANPQAGLWDRVAAVKRIVPDVPVTGFVAFTARARFAKGQPRSVVLLEALLRDLASERDRQAIGVDSYRPFWERLRETAQLAGMDQGRG
jgi:hypothetical protein